MPTMGLMHSTSHDDIEVFGINMHIVFLSIVTDGHPDLVLEF